MWNLVKMLNDMKRLILTFAFMLSCALISAAQEAKMEILPDKKVLYVSRLGLPGPTAVIDVLRSIPELASKGAVMEFGNFDIQYDGKTTGGGRDVILEQTRISELEKVEITISPTVDQQQSGQGGVINLIPVKLREGISGETFLKASSAWDLMPGVNLNYKKNKLEIRSSLNLEYYHPEEMKVSESYKAERNMYTVDTITTTYGQETAKIFLKYDATPDDCFKMFVWESFELERVDQRRMTNTLWDRSGDYGPGWIFEEDTWTKEGSSENHVIASALLEYKHDFRQGTKLNVSASYKYDNKNVLNLISDKLTFRYSPYVVNGEIKAEHVFFDNVNGKLEFNSGANSSYTPDKSNVSVGSMLYLSPFVTLKYRTGAFSVHAGARYQYNKRFYSSSGLDEFSKDEHDVTANLNLLWNLNENHSLRLIGTRNVIRPGSDKLYPMMVTDYNSGKYILGNPNLSSTLLHAVDAVYVFRKQDEVSTWIISTGLGYDIAHNLIKEEVRPLLKAGEVNGTDFYSTYKNSGRNHILRGNLSMTYQKGIFSLLFSGNVFGNFNTDNGVGDNHSYFNLSVTPIFNFNNNWVLAAKAVYNSSIVTRNLTYGDALVVSLDLSRAFGKWTVYAGLSDVFDYFTSDVSVTADETFINSYDPYSRNVSLGFSYRF